MDDTPTNRILLRVRLAAAFYDVLQAGSPTETLEMLALHRPDLVLLNARLGDSDSLALCRAITGKSEGAPLDGKITSTQDGNAAHPPVLILSGQCDRHFRLAALQAGAEDVLAFPQEELLLLARLRNLMRAGDVAQESHLRDGTSRTLGFAEGAASFVAPARLCVVADDAGQPQPWMAELSSHTAGQLTGRISHHDSRLFLHDVSAGDTPDLCLIVITHPQATPGLRLLSELRAHPETRHAAAIVILPQHDPHIAADALDLGASDVLTGDVDVAELALKINLQIRRKRLADHLRSSLRDGLRAALTDPLTGLYNRRYALPHLARMAEHAARSGRKFAVMLADLDHFKAINDRYGHVAGDAVLVEVAHRLRANLRAVDLVARIGGEEFLIALPDTDRTEARVAARRLCRIIAQDPFVLPGEGLSAPVTISIGVTLNQTIHPQANLFDPDPDPVQRLLSQADKALYGAKACGRNQVTLSKPAA